METTADNYTNEALAFITLYKTMSPKIKEQVKDMIVNDIEDKETDNFTSLSLQSWDNGNDGLEESKIWGKLYGGL